jgi:hypothetical protein
MRQADLGQREEQAPNGKTTQPRENNVSRRTFLKYAAALACAPALYAGQSRVSAWFSPEVTNPVTPIASDSVDRLSAVISHDRFLASIEDLAGEMNLTSFLRDFKELMRQTALSCVTDESKWVIPSKAYGFYLYTRDSYWVSMALKHPGLAEVLAKELVAGVRQKPSGQVITFLRRDAAIVDGSYRNDESSLLYVMHCYLLHKLGGQIPVASIEKARNYILSQVVNGRYVTTGETRTGESFNGDEQLGTYHYWADTYRPAGKALASPEVITYNQGLLCIALQCLEDMGISFDPQARIQAEAVYANLVNPQDGVSMPLREGGTAVDVSALVGEALSLYLFNRPLLSNARVNATFGRFTRVRYREGGLLGFKVISDFNGGYRPSTEFSGSPVNLPGGYQNGGSWFLYDMLALYAGARHGVAQANKLFIQRMLSEVSHSWSSHEYLHTDAGLLGLADPDRDGYGWNSFVLNLLP